MQPEIVPDSLPRTAREVDERVDSPSESVSSLARFAASSGTSLGNEVIGSPSSSRSKTISKPRSLLIDSVRKNDGEGPVVDLGEYCGKLLVVTLGITDVIERTGLTVSVWGSKDQIDWGAKPLVTFRQRQYCGVYSVLLNMAPNPAVRFLRVHWNMNCWGKSERIPSFGFQVFFEESGARISGTPA